MDFLKSRFYRIGYGVSISGYKIRWIFDKVNRLREKNILIFWNTIEFAGKSKIHNFLRLPITYCISTNSWANPGVGSMDSNSLDKV